MMLIKKCLCLYTQIIATHSLTWRILFWLREAINEQIRDGSRECEKVYGSAINKTFILHSLDLKEHCEIDI